MPEILVTYDDNKEKIVYLPFSAEGLERLFYAFDSAYLYEPSGTVQESFLRAGLIALRRLCNP